MRNRHRFGIILAVVATVAITSAAPAAADSIYADSVDGNVTGFASLRCLDAKAEELGRNGTAIQLWDCYGSSQLNQLWYKHTPPNTYKVQLRSRYDNRCLDADWQTIGQNGTKVQLWDCYGAEQRNQLWEFWHTPNVGIVQIRNVQTGQCLDADYWGFGQNGTRVQLWDCYGLGSHNQLWFLPRAWY